MLGKSNFRCGETDREDGVRCQVRSAETFRYYIESPHFEEKLSKDLHLAFPVLGLNKRDWFSKSSNLVGPEPGTAATDHPNHTIGTLS